MRFPGDARCVEGMRHASNGTRILVGRRYLGVGHRVYGWRVLGWTSDLLGGPLVPPYECVARRVGQANVAGHGRVPLRCVHNRGVNQRKPSARPTRIRVPGRETAHLTDAFSRGCAMRRGDATCLEWHADSGGPALPRRWPSGLRVESSLLDQRLSWWAACPTLQSLTMLQFLIRRSRQCGGAAFSHLEALTKPPYGLEIRAPWGGFVRPFRSEPWRNRVSVA